MIDWSNTYFRQLMRILSCNAMVFTEMVTTGAIEHNPTRSLEYHLIEHPIALQLGGSNALALSQCARKAESYGYDEINLNAGCPSHKVQSGNFGARLMAQPKTVANAVSAMKDSVSVPVSIKTRIGIDQMDSYEFFFDFVNHQVEAGIDKVIIHARKAWLKGLSPKENRNIPPINYDFVYKLKRDFPKTPIVINGDITSIQEIQGHLHQVDGVMLGRIACNNPYFIHQIAITSFSNQRHLSRAEVFSLYIATIEAGLKKSVPISIILKPIMGLCYSIPGSKLWKKKLCDSTKTNFFNQLSQLEKLILQLEQQDHGNNIHYLVH